ncbi:P-loop ATPase, Sll1717 family [Cypionkella sp.]|uniref:P-loop ATPase, Sll1717 family n=1 Tax=Cypionkella sp. TaxID=2811411 RepID=UPI00271D8795|nr:hypothetical protein [Cypionkella sp.]MDO8982511.1 hypothetical protein [Cypionkella sp.]MDP2050514.1 hypothetical protein [Cypionkella sp.]
MTDFKKIKFGWVSAEAERANDPGLLTDGHIDFRSMESEATEGKKYLFLGYKGSGKSTLAERMDLTLSGRFDKFVKVVSLGDFPFTPFSKIIKGDEEPESKFPAAWSWILLIYVLESFEKDKGAQISDAEVFNEAIGAFRAMGLSPSASPSAIVRKSSKTNFSVTLPGKLAEYVSSGGEVKNTTEIFNFVESLKSIASRIRSGSNHYLIIDGLDDILTTREVQYKSLAALIYEIGKLNELFSRNSVPFKIIVLCRTDLFDRIPGPNKNKIRQSYALELDWYHDVKDPDNSLLFRAATIRAERSLARSVKIVEEFFPPYINSTPSKQYLLDLTRHTPRDFLQLLSHMQEFCSGNRLSESNVRSASRDYSIKYFLPEIRDELAGYALPNEIEAIISALSLVGKRDFKISELFAASKATLFPLSDQQVYTLCVALFNCSAIGNIDSMPQGKTSYSFKYRNRSSAFNDAKSIMLHRGLWKALNIV